MFQQKSSHAVHNTSKPLAMFTANPTRHINPKPVLPLPRRHCISASVLRHTRASAVSRMPAQPASHMLEASQLKQYLHRIGMEVPEQLPPPDLSTLQLVHRHHTIAVVFENMSIVVPEWRALDIGPAGGLRLDVPSLYNKIVTRRRGGYCFEVNTLLTALLQGLGYSVRLGAASVILDGMQVNPQLVQDHTYSVTAVEHKLLFVSGGDLPDGQEYIVDCGFGGNTMTHAIALPMPGSAEEQHLQQNHRWDPPADHNTPQFRVRWGIIGRTTLPTPRDSIHDQGWYLQTWANRPDGSGAWHDLYWFTPRTCKQHDYVPPNYYLSMCPESGFAKGPFCTSIDSENRRWILLGKTLSCRHMSGHKDIWELDSHEDVASALQKHFSIHLPDGACIQPLQSPPPASSTGNANAN